MKQIQHKGKLRDVFVVAKADTEAAIAIGLKINHIIMYNKKLHRIVDIVGDDLHIYII